MSTYYARNREARLKYQTEYQLKNREKIRPYNTRYRNLWNYKRRCVALKDLLKQRNSTITSLEDKIGSLDGQKNGELDQTVLQLKATVEQMEKNADKAQSKIATMEQTILKLNDKIAQTEGSLWQMKRNSRGYFYLDLND